MSFLEEITKKAEKKFEDGEIPTGSITDNIIVLAPGQNKARCKKCRNLVMLTDRIREWECCGTTFALAPTL